MSHKLCMYCLKDLSAIRQLDFTREIVCGDCVQGLVGSSALPVRLPKKPPESPRKPILECKPIKYTRRI